MNFSMLELVMINSPVFVDPVRSLGRSSSSFSLFLGFVSIRAVEKIVKQGRKESLKVAWRFAGELVGIAVESIAKMFKVLIIRDIM